MRVFKNFHLYCGILDIKSINLYNERDAHILTSAHACALPAYNGKVEFAIDSQILNLNF